MLDTETKATKGLRAREAARRTRARKPSKAEGNKAKTIAQALPPDYAPTAAEVDLVARQKARRVRQTPAPQVSVEHRPPGAVQISPDHPDGLLWQRKLQASMGTVEWAFAEKLLSDLLNAACPSGAGKPISADDVNAAVAAMHGLAPSDEAEAMLVAQMVATHRSAMMALRRLNASENIPQQDSNSNASVKLLRTYAAQIEALSRYRGKGKQEVRVEHVHVHQGGRAIVGSVSHGEGPGGGGHERNERQPHALAYAPGEAVPCPDAARDAVPVASGRRSD